MKTAVLACSCDSEFSHLAWVNTPRNQGGLGEMKIPIIADFTKKIATDYGVLKEDEGVAYRGLFIIDPKQVVRQITINDLPVGRNVDEVVRLVEAFQFTDEVLLCSWSNEKLRRLSSQLNKSTKVVPLFLPLRFHLYLAR